MTWTARRAAFVPVIAFVVLFAGMGAAHATTLVPLSVEQMTEMAETIVIAEAESLTVRPVPGPGGAVSLSSIETDVGMRVIQALKGRARADLDLTVSGGVLGEHRLLATWEPTFSPGERSILFLDSTGRLLGPQAKLDVRGGDIPALDQSVSQVLGLILGAEAPGPVAPESAIVRKPAQAVLPDTAPAVFVAPAAFIAPAALTTELDDGFEVDGWLGWQTWDSALGVDWTYSSYRSSVGFRSAYCDDSVVAGGPYSTNVSSWLYAGPFDLSDANAAALAYDFFIDTGSGDALSVLFSTNGSTFSGFTFGMQTTGFWSDSVDLGAIPGTGVDLIGESTVWFAFLFQSDGVPNLAEGVYVDAVTLTKQVGGPEITDISPDSGSAGTDTEVTITGTDFGVSQGTGHVDFTYDSSGGTTIEAPVTSWGDTAITCVIPIVTDPLEYPGAAGTGPVTITTDDGQVSAGYQFDVTFAYGDLKWPTDEVPYVLNANTADTLHEEARFDAGAHVWNAASTFDFVDAGSSLVAASTADGVNEVFWNSTALPAGVVAAAAIWYTGDTIIEADICFNDTLTWGDAAPGVYDIQTIAIHELGHWLNLRDLYGSGDSAKIMYGYGGPGVSKHDLHEDDIAGVRWIYPSVITVDRIAGNDRYETAVSIAQEHFASLDVTTVVVATGEDFPDALSGAGLAGAYDAPLLLVRHHAIPSCVSALLETYTNLERVFVIGGTSVVEPAVEDDLAAFASVQRIAGVNRYETAADVARAIASRMAGDFSHSAFFARGDVFADALAVSPLAYATAAPILLTRTTSLPEQTSDVITELSIRSGVVAGGTGAVGDPVKDDIDTLLIANGGSASLRWAGDTRYGTAAVIAENGAAVMANDLSFVGMATGTNFPDALGGGVAAGKEGGVLLLSSPSSLSPEPEALLLTRISDISEVELFGGTGALSGDVEDSIYAIVQ